MPGTGCKSIAQDCMQVLQNFVSETHQKRSRKYFVSESQGAPFNSDDQHKSVNHNHLSFLAVIGSVIRLGYY